MPSLSKFQAKFKLRDFLNADVFLSSITGNICTILPVMFVLYLPSMVYTLLFEISFCFIFLVVGIGLGIWIQRKWEPAEDLKKIGTNTAKLQLDKMKGVDLMKEASVMTFPGPAYKEDSGAAIFNEIFGALWPDLAKGLNDKLVCEPSDVGGNYDLEITQMGLDTLTAKFNSVKALRPHYQDPTHACVVGEVTISGIPKSKIRLHSKSALKPNVDVRIKSIVLKANLYCRVDCNYWKLWIWFDKDLKIDVKLDLDVSIFPLAVNWVVDALLSSLLKFSEKDPWTYDCVDWDGPDPLVIAEKGAEEYLKTVHGKVHGVLVITACSANNLLSKDHGSFGRALKKARVMKTGMPDPYLKIMYDENTVKTKPIKKTNSPAWPDQFNFIITKAFGTMQFEVWDWDRTSKDDFLAKTSLNVDVLMKTTKTQKWTWPLYPKGNLTIETTWRPHSENVPSKA